MNKHKAALIDHAKTKPVYSHYTSLADYNASYTVWHDRYIVLTLIASRQTNKG